MKKINWYGANYKDWVGVSAAPVFWVASLICFVLGLSFKQGTGIYIPGTTMDLAMLFSLGLGLANTAIQIVGNDTDKEDLGMALWLMWGGSYILGVGSNVNFLYTVVGLNQPLLQFMVCWGLGIMIEVAPERLLVRWLRGVGILPSLKSQPAQQPQRHAPQQYQAPRQDNEQRQREEPRERPQQSQRSQVAQDAPPFLQNRGNGQKPEPTYHKITNVEEGTKLTYHPESKYDA